MKKIYYEKHWKLAYEMFQNGNKDDALEVYKSISSIMSYNPYFLYNYGAELSVYGNYQESIDVLRSVENRINDADYYTCLGSNYFQLGDMQNAILNYQKASNIMPVRYYPKYCLVQSYYMQKDFGKANALAEEILSMPIKIPSTTINQIREEMRMFTIEYQKQNLLIQKQSLLLNQ
ncbi:hypothetical protein ES708_17591 [subsurface metagenome]